MNAHLILRDIRPAQNRYRIYEIRIGSIILKGQVHYSVILAWGRIGNRKQRKVLFCHSQEELDKMLQQILRTRYRHGYQLADKSLRFPSYDILDHFQPATPLLSQQLSLFAN